MGKASQAKKAAREARASGTVPARPRRRLGFPALVAAVVVVGALAIWWARRPETQSPADVVTPPIELPSTTTAPSGGTADTTPTTVAP